MQFLLPGLFGVIGKSIGGKELSKISHSAKKVILSVNCFVIFVEFFLSFILFFFFLQLVTSFYNKYRNNKIRMVLGSFHALISNVLLSNRIASEKALKNILHLLEVKKIGKLLGKDVANQIKLDLKVIKEDNVDIDLKISLINNCVELLKGHLKIYV